MNLLKSIPFGRIIVCLKGGDTAIFANLTDEIQVAREINIPYQIVPGITSCKWNCCISGDGVRSARYLIAMKRS